MSHTELRSFSSPMVPRAVQILSGVCLANAVITILLGSSGVPHTYEMVSAVLGLATASAGVLLVRLAVSGPSYTFRRWFGLLLIVFGVSTLPDVFSHWLSPGPFLASYVVLVLLMAGMFVMGITRLPTRPRPYKVSRSILEALVIGFASGGFLYRVTLERWGPQGMAGFGQQAALIALLSVLWLAVISITLDTGRGMGVSVVGAALIILAEVCVLLSPPDLDVDLVGRSVESVGWALAILGVFLIPARLRAHPDSVSPRIESRNLSFVGTMIVLTAGSFLVTFAFDPDLPPLTWVLCSGFLTLLWARELVRARQSRDLLQQLDEQVNRDPLTGVRNRRALERSLERITRAPTERMSFLTVDLDGFKDVNDQLGHGTGDDLLIRVAQRLSEVAARHDAEVFRVGGDEFAVLAAQPLAAGVEMAEQMVEAVVDCGRQVAGVGRVAMGASVGIRHLDMAGGFTQAQAQAALSESGHAMRAAKLSGRGRVVVFDWAFAERHRRRRLVEARLSDPSTPRPTVCYQPVVSLTTGRMVGVEALARWSDPILGEVEPAEFVEIAEDRGLIHALGDHILNTALDGALQSGLTDRGLTVSVNVSTIQLRAPGFADIVCQALERSGVRPEQLILEVTETIFVRSEDPALKTLDALAGLGIGLSLDDFGAGYSSLSHLARLPVRILKVDRSLTERLAEPKTQAIIRSVVEMANGLGLMVVIEGVETPEQTAQSRALGVGFAQGWHFRAAVDQDTLRDLLTCPTWARADRGALVSGTDRRDTTRSGS